MSRPGTGARNGSKDTPQEKSSGSTSLAFIPKMIAGKIYPSKLSKLLPAKANTPMKDGGYEKTAANSGPLLSFKASGTRTASSLVFRKCREKSHNGRSRQN